MPGKVQAVIFGKNHWTLGEAAAKVNSMGFKPIKKPHITSDYFRFRIRKPNFRRYRTKTLHKGIKIIIGY